MTLTSIDLVLPLDEVGSADAPRVGHKAATLGALKRAGFPVPEGVVVATEALTRTLAAAGLGAGAGPDQVEAVPLPSEVAAAIATVAERLGGGPLAVRSSGVDEDLPGASYAGQYESVLGVPAAGLPAAVRRCWASAFTRHVAAYQHSRGVARGVAMAVLVQPMVAAEAAGVAFSADPVTGDRATAVVNAVRGLGDRLVAGRASPDEWAVSGTAATCRAAPEGVIDAEVATDVAALARRVEARLGAPQDIEWALADGELVLLQARPITALPGQVPEPVPVPVEVPSGFWEREASHAPTPWTPMTLSVALGQPRNRAVRRVFDEFGLLAETLEWAQIGGWEYVRLVPLGGKDRPAPAARLMPLLIRLAPRLRRRIRDAVAAVRSDKAGRFVEQWYEQWQPDLAARIAVLRDTNLGAVDDDELDARTGRALALLHEGVEIHFLLHGALTLILAELAFACRELLGWADEEAFELLGGLSATSTEPAHRLAELAGTAARRPAVRRLLDQVEEGTLGRLAATDPDFAEAFAAYQREFACRAIRYEIADPSIAELPELTLRLLADQLAGGYDPVVDAAALAHRRMTAAGRARAALAGRPPGDRERFERALARAERAYPVREDNEFFTLSVPIALLRYPVLEIGRRLAARGQLDRRDDVFFLTLEEARAALRDGQDRRALVTRRRGERAFVEQHPGPATYGKDPGPPPPLEALPAEARFTMNALLWYIDRIFEAAPSSRAQQAGTQVLGGIAASPGRYTGPVRLVMDEFDFGKLRPGDVLVCPITSPVWSVLFPSVGAVVTDTGGLLSHPAIIAREYGVPAVVATGNATGLLRDGQVVTVDGSAGRIEVQP
ncbi:MAG TPA: PEP/pyruvate-binding domain-containing protein [Actinomycetes bacterium]|nr:PEP/pyruvate-binding domain-containing protein [Actinomycetes bacterium]